MDRATAVNAFLAKAKADIGVEEVPRGSNRGPRVEAMLAHTGLDGGYPWCAAAVVTWGIEGLGKTWPLPKSADCDVLLDYARRHNVLRTTPQVGDIFLVLASPYDAIHTGVVTAVSGATVQTIEGNSNNNGSREGFQVVARARTVSGSLKFIRWPELREDFTGSASGWSLTVGNNTTVVPAELIDGSAYVPLRALLECLFPKEQVEQTLGWGEIGATWDQKPLPFPCRLKDQTAWCPVRKAAEWLGLSVAVTGQKIHLVRL